MDNQPQHSVGETEKDRVDRRRLVAIEDIVKDLAHRLTVGLVQLDSLSGKPAQEIRVSDFQWVRSFISAPENSAFGRARRELQSNSMAYEMAQEEVRDILRGR